MTTSKSSLDFWSAAQDIISETERHPFLVSMVDGSLNKDSFQYYVVQDALYLTDFADALRMLGNSKESSAEDSKRLHEFAKGAEEAELALHNSFFQKWNIHAEGAQQMPNCLLYTSYMKRVVATHSHAEGLAVLLPCFWVYMHVGQKMLELRERLKDSVQRPPEYDAWIDMYGGEDFANEVRDYIAMVDAAIQRSSDETVDRMQEHFVMCCRLEHMFWDQASVCLQWPEIKGLANSVENY